VAPRVEPAWLAGLAFATLSLLVVLLLSALAAATARVTIDRAARFYWRTALAVAVLCGAASLLPGFQR
jgi:hypothetical protein